MRAIITVLSVLVLTCQVRADESKKTFSAAVCRPARDRGDDLFFGVPFALYLERARGRFPLGDQRASRHL